MLSFVTHFVHVNSKLLSMVSESVPQPTTVNFDVGLSGFAPLPHIRKLFFTNLRGVVHTYKQGIGIEAIRQNHSIHIQALIQFLFNSHCSRSHSNSIPYNWDSIQIIPANFAIPCQFSYHSIKFLIPEIHSLHILVFTPSTHHSSNF